jgi:hypothetical protein
MFHPAFGGRSRHLINSRAVSTPDHFLRGDLSSRGLDAVSPRAGQF